jgi:hypothetical protein
MVTHKCNWAKVGDKDDRKSCRAADVCDAHDEENCDECTTGIQIRMIHSNSKYYLVNDASTGYNPGF